MWIIHENRDDSFKCNLSSHKLRLHIHFQASSGDLFVLLFCCRAAKTAKKLFRICSEKASVGRRAAQKPECIGIHEDFEQRVRLNHAFAVRS